MPRLLVVTAVPAERDAVARRLASTTTVEIAPGLSGVSAATGVGAVHLLAAGIGPIAAATGTAAALATRGYDAVISVGVAGGLAERAGIGAVVVATASVVADLGCRTPGGFVGLGELGFAQPDSIDFPAAGTWAERLEAAGTPVVLGDVLTVTTATGTHERARELAATHPTAVAEAMEGFGVAWAAQTVRPGLTCGEVRAVSNQVGLRDRARWDLAGALDALSRAAAALLAEPLS